MISSESGREERKLVNLFILHPHRANDAPYGRFIPQNPSITVDQSVPSIIARSLLYTITREGGAIGDVMIDVTTTYDPVRIRNLCTLSKTIMIVCVCSN